MAFWGIEVKPGKPYTHFYDNTRGRLRICQATLGNGKSDLKSVVQCNVGKKSPILLCALIPDKTESCHIEVEFEEDEEVIFSVLGQRSIHLSGYYIGKTGRNLDGDETESYGEDIADTDSGSFGEDEDEDEYESDFIDDDDDDVEMFGQVHRRKSGVVIEEIIEDEKPSNGNGTRRRLKKKHQLSDSDDADDSSRQLAVKCNNSVISESEDEDGFPICFSSKKKTAAKDSEAITKSDGKPIDEDNKGKINAITQEGEAVEKLHDTVLPSELIVENHEKLKKKKKEKARDGMPLETVAKVSVEEHKVESSCMETDVTENDGKPKNKKEKKGKKGKRFESDIEEVNEKPNEDNVTMDQDHPVSTELCKLPTDNETIDFSVSPATAKENSVKSSKKKNKNKKRKGLPENEPTAEAVDLPTNVAHTVEVEETSEVNQKDAKKRKKKNKNTDKDSISNQQLVAERKPDEEADVHPQKKRTFGNGLVIEDLKMGSPDGKKATPGSKVSVNYIGKLKNGTIFDSNVGQRPFKFRLGVGQVIKGWDIGVNGMRAGDKRRLIIPPSFGYGEKGAGKQIPGNSWLEFDVELVSVQ